MATWGQQINGAPGKGVNRGYYRQAVIKIGHDQFDDVRAKAERDGTSLAEAFRTLIEWGLMAERGDT